jgi:hypothetical protein
MNSILGGMGAHSRQYSSPSNSSAVDITIPENFPNKSEQ